MNASQGGHKQYRGLVIDAVLQTTAPSQDIFLLYSSKARGSYLLKVPKLIEKLKLQVA